MKFYNEYAKMLRNAPNRILNKSFWHWIECKNAENDKETKRYYLELALLVAEEYFSRIEVDEL